MGAAQQALYTCNADDLSAQAFLDAVCASGSVGFARNVTISREPDSGRISKVAAMPLALIVNELLTNAAKYGANDRGRVTINVGLNVYSGLHELYVQDDGSGFDFEEVQERSSGLGLVSALVRRLNGTFVVERKLGTRCTVRFSHRSEAPQ